MPKPIAEWNEDDVFGLPQGENDTFERKGSRLLDLTIAGVREDDVLNELAKQLSAFANVGGGRIIYGVNDTGGIDNGGVSRNVRGRQPTKAWLEDVIPTLTEFEIVGVNVYEILPKTDGSVIDTSKSLYVVDVPDSNRAPHQSKRDFKYYVRLGGRSLPASHRLIEDIRTRQKSPMLDLSGLRLQVLTLPLFSTTPLSFGGDIRLRLTLRLKNVGKIMAKNACFNLKLPAGFNSQGHDNQAVRPRGFGSPFWEVLGPVYPGMEIEFFIDLVAPAEVGPPRGEAQFGGPWLISGQEVDRVQFGWNVFADDSETKGGTITLESLEFHALVSQALDEHREGRRIRQIYRFLVM